MDPCSIDGEDPISFLEKFEDGWNSDPPMKDAVRRLKLMISILIPFVRCFSVWQIENKILEVHLKPIASALENLIQGFRLCGTESVHPSRDADWRPSPATAKLILSNLEQLSLVKPQMKVMYSVLSKSQNSITRKSSGEDVVSYISVLLQNLNDILSYKDDDNAVVLVKEQIQSLEEKLRFLRNFLCFVLKRCCEHCKLKDLFTYSKAVAVNAACLLYFCLVDNQKDDNKLIDLETEIFYLVSKIKPLQPEIRLIYAAAQKHSSSSMPDAPIMDEFDLGFVDFLVNDLRDLLNNTASFKFAAKDRRGILLEELRFLRYNLLDPPLHASFSKEMNALMLHAEALIIETGYFVSFGAESRKQNALLSNMLEKIKHIKEEARDCYDKLIPKSWQSNFPKTNELEFIDFILKNLKEQPNYKTALIDLLTCQAETIHEELVALREDFSEMVGLCNETEKLRPLFTRYKDVAYQVEYFVDLTVSGEVSLHCQKLVHFNLREEIRHIQKEIKAIKDDFTVHTIARRLHPVSSEASHLSLDALTSSIGGMRSKQDAAPNQLVGLENEAKKIIEQLTRGSTPLKILSIVGMPGIGKTTLSCSVYNDPSVTHFFHVRAWCSVSQVYRRETLLSEILHQITGQSSQNVELDIANYFAEKVYKSLKGNRYLVVIDDIWTVDAWNVIKESFPDDNNGSRIIFTTRNHSVALQANSVPYALRLLSDEESWKLLQVKVFKEETCPPELLHVGKRIAENCKGLPLSVVLIAGLLKVTENRQDCWEQVAQRSRSHVIDNPPKQHLNILELSYKHLPDHLKPCFLYFAAFPEGTEIPVSKLVRLWIAEGFVQQPKEDQKSLEEEAEKYLNDLIDRSLVIVAKRSSRGGIQACIIHDILRDFCLDKAQEDTFLLEIVNKDGLATFSESELGEQYRLCIYSNRIPSVKMGHIESRVRTLLLRECREVCQNSNSTTVLIRSAPRWFEQFHGIDVLFKFRLLRVLDLEAIRIEAESVFYNVILLDHLRYLALLASTREIPTELANLKKLETFILKGPIGEVALPWSIWNMASLRHVHISKNSAIFFPWQNHISEFLNKCTELGNFKSISTLVLCHGKDVLEKMMRKLPNLRRLGCIFSDPGDDLLESNPFPELAFLSQLESLKISFTCKEKIQYPGEFSFPANLKKLTLSASGLPWETISVIGKLPNLEVLKLLSRAFKGQQWDMTEGEFQKLKFLKLDMLDIAIWNASSEHLPLLE